LSTRVEEIDARRASDSILERYVWVEHGCWPETNPGEPQRSTAEAIAYLRFQPETHASFHFLADGGCASLYVHGPRAAFMHVLVHPLERRKGMGDLLLGAVVARARDVDVQALHAHHSTPAGAAFAARFGFVDNQRIVRSLLDLRTAELSTTTPPAGWAIVTWLDHVPEEHLEAFVAARAAMDDAPTPEEMEFPNWTAEQIRASEKSLRRRNREMRVTVALRDDGVIGAFTELRVSRGSTLGFTDDTGTVASHRGQGLARAVKVESLRRLRDDHPAVEVVTTSNAEENTVMRHLNESIGFRPSLLEVTTTLAVPGAFRGSR